MPVYFFFFFFGGSSSELLSVLLLLLLEELESESNSEEEEELLDDGEEEEVEELSSLSLSSSEEEVEESSLSDEESLAELSLLLLLELVTLLDLKQNKQADEIRPPRDSIQHSVFSTLSSNLKINYLSQKISKPDNLNPYALCPPFPILNKCILAPGAAAEQHQVREVTRTGQQREVPFESWQGCGPEQ